MYTGIVRHVYIQGVSKKMSNNEMILWGAYRHLFDRIMILDPLIEDTSACLGTTATIFVVFQSALQPLQALQSELI